MTPALLSQILAHARAEAPREACGVLAWDGKDGAAYHPCRNVAGDGDFEIHPEDWVAAEDAGTVLGIVHSHPGGTVDLSGADRAGLYRSGVPWWVVVPESGAWGRYVPSGREITGHPFAWGIQDCFTLVRDGVAGVPDFLREPLFWERSDLISESMEVAGFERVEDGPAPGDVLVMSIRGRGVPNHCAVYVGGGRIVHHLAGRLSREEDLGPLNRAVVAVVRRKR
jgi:proteasome lid subunit RPN8/RPN11